jgi:hypothetical protein
MTNRIMLPTRDGRVKNVAVELLLFLDRSLARKLVAPNNRPTFAAPAGRKSCAQKMGTIVLGLSDSPIPARSTGNSLTPDQSAASALVGARTKERI